MTRVIRREDAQTLRQVQGLLEAADLKCRRLHAEALARAQEEGAQGEVIGLAMVRREQAREMFRALMQRDAYLAGAQRQVIGVVINAVRRIMPDFDGNEQVAEAVATALERSRTASRAQVRLASPDEATWRARLARDPLASKAAHLLELAPDASLRPGHARLDSPWGALDCDAAGLLDALELAAGLRS